MDASFLLVKYATLKKKKNLHLHLFSSALYQPVEYRAAYVEIGVKGTLAGW